MYPSAISLSLSLSVCTALHTAFRACGGVWAVAGHHGCSDPCLPLTLQDFSSGTFFNRVIDDGKASDNTRHLSHHPKTGEPFLLPPMDIRRVLLVRSKPPSAHCALCSICS